ncbi:helix-turn-helix transcriptional regulator [Frankia sp. R43]|uniref:helix-turn-helix domain-containing protein n=1 Tax=Frankia sp. R43 TaxID=269536 RepID=UPI0006C9F7D9|nr:helix-turn-helix transcriptional regulator [Frankia sp. R43]
MNKSTDDPSSGVTVTRRLGADLAALRRGQKVTGQQLAGRLPMSQSKISRIETGAVTPTPEDVEAIVRALGQAEDVVADFRSRAESQFGLGPSAEEPAGHYQSMYQEYEQRSTEIVSWQPDLVPGLLQTSGYATAIISRFGKLFDSNNMINLVDQVARRLERQRVLYEEKRFTFVIMEAVLRYAVTTPIEMATQIEHLQKMASRPNIKIAIIPDGVHAAYPPGQGFTLFDDATVLVDITTTVLRIHDPADLAAYQRMIRAFEGQATAERDTLFRKYLDHYINLHRDQSE